MEGNLSDYKQKLDNNLTSVMPDSWDGHGRALIRESEAVPEQIEESAIEKMERLADEKGVSPERVAEKLIDKIEAKRADK